jgi:hypothetical protein
MREAPFPVHTTHPELVHTTAPERIKLVHTTRPKSVHTTHPEGMAAISRGSRERRDRYPRETTKEFLDPGGGRSSARWPPAFLPAVRFILDAKTCRKAPLPGKKAHLKTLLFCKRNSCLPANDHKFGPRTEGSTSI